MSSAGTAVVPQAAPGNATWDVALIAARNESLPVVAVLDRLKLGHRVHADPKIFLRRSQRQRASVVVLCADDASSGLISNVELLARSLPETPLVVVCPALERRVLRAVLAAGAAGIVLCEELEQALGACIGAALAGQTCVPRGHWRQIDPPALSTREKQILGLVVMGYTNSQIAGQLFLAESTVKSHLSSSFGKLGVRSRNEAVELIIDPERGLGMGILSLVAE
jgi:DNA-binding NarL/FixJ family response regulator